MEYNLLMVHPILVVEDDRKIAKVVRVYLEGAGYRVVHAELVPEIGQEPDYDAALKALD